MPLSDGEKTLRQQLTKTETLVTNDEADQILIEHTGPHGKIQIDLCEVLEAIDSLHHLKCGNLKTIPNLVEIIDGAVSDIAEKISEEQDNELLEHRAADRAESLGYPAVSIFSI